LRTGEEYRAVTQILRSFVQLMKSLLSFTGDSDNIPKDLKLVCSQIDHFITHFKTNSNHLRKSVMILTTEVETFLKEWTLNENTITLKNIASSIKEISQLIRDGNYHILPNSVVPAIPPAGKESVQELPEVVLGIIFSHFTIPETLRLCSVCTAWKNALDKPDFYRDRNFAILSRMFIKKEDQSRVNKNADYSIYVKIQPDVLQFLQGRGNQITKFVLRTPDAKEATIFMRFISSRITHLTFSFGEIVEPLFADNQFWVEVLESSSLVYLNFQETKLSKMQVPVQIRDKVREIFYPPFVYNAYACYDYNHSDPNSREFFSFKAGDKFQILPSVRDLQGWRIAVNEQGEKGFVPGNYLVMLNTLVVEM